MTGSLWRIMARAAATCWMERVPFAANPADAPSTGRREKKPKKVSGGKPESEWVFFLGAEISAAPNKKPGTAFRKKRRWSVSILKQGCVIDRPASARSAWGPRGRMSMFPISYTLYAPMPAITHWTSRAVAQSFVAEIPFIAEACRRDRYATELGFFFPGRRDFVG